MKKESAIKYIKNHINGQKNKIADLIIKNVYKKVISAGGIPPFRITKISQLAEEIGEAVDAEMGNINQGEETEGEEINEALGDENEDNSFLAEPLSSTNMGTYSLSKGNIELSNYDAVNGILYNQIILQPDENQKKTLIENTQQDGDSVFGSVTLYPPDSEEKQDVLVPEGFDGIAVFTPFSKEDGSKTDEEINGFYSMS